MLANEPFRILLKYQSLLRLQLSLKVALHGKKLFIPKFIYDWAFSNPSEYPLLWFLQLILPFPQCFTPCLQFSLILIIHHSWDYNQVFPYSEYLSPWVYNLAFSYPKRLSIILGLQWAFPRRRARLPAREIKSTRNFWWRSQSKLSIFGKKWPFSAIFRLIRKIKFRKFRKFLPREV